MVESEPTQMSVRARTTSFVDHSPGIGMVALSFLLTSDDDAVCSEGLCAVDEYVQSHECVACPPGTTNAAGDDMSGANTTCDGTASFHRLGVLTTITVYSLCGVWLISFCVHREVVHLLLQLPVVTQYWAKTKNATMAILW